MKKILLQVILLAAIAGLVWWLYSMFNTPLEFERVRKEREAKVVERLKDIRTAQRAFRSKYQKFTPNFDSLIAFVANDSLVVAGIRPVSRYGSLLPVGSGISRLSGMSCPWFVQSASYAAMLPSLSCTSTL